jgi:hypothetical protein
LEKRGCQPIHVGRGRGKRDGMEKGVIESRVEMWVCGFSGAGTAFRGVRPQRETGISGWYHTQWASVIMQQGHSI